MSARTANFQNHCADEPVTIPDSMCDFKGCHQKKFKKGGRESREQCITRIVQAIMSHPMFVPRSVISQKDRENSSQKQTLLPRPSEDSERSHCSVVTVKIVESLALRSSFCCVLQSHLWQKHGCLHQNNRNTCSAPVLLGVCRQMFRLIGRLTKRARV